MHSICDELVDGVYKIGVKWDMSCERSVRSRERSSGERVVATGADPDFSEESTVSGGSEPVTRKKIVGMSK